ncbi:thioredoxin-like 4, chloroplastic [Pyrus x bretschneideri]|uniref:thioredoxin-like 4, chloroplastic n=1 Tax=Pyrus x bretschneideri TaxID=225117 RepID=UPI00202FA6DF|nr:thioredoxin-like 4, chloroplastic [Pyrus x bretschneideri]
MMHRQSILYGKAKASFNFVTKPNTKLGSTSPSQVKSRLLRTRNPSTIIKTTALEVSGFRGAFGHLKARVATGNLGELSEEDDDDVCPVECVREFRTDAEFSKILERARESGALVVVDFYRTSCGSCKYIEQGFAKLCKGAGDGEAAVIFLKHNVIDEYDEQSEVADRLRIKTVPLFHFYKDGVLLEAFPTRDKERITAAISKYTTPASQEV